MGFIAHSMRITIKYRVGDLVSNGTYTGVIRYIIWNMDDHRSETKYLVQIEGHSWRVTMREEEMSLIGRKTHRNRGLKAL